MTHRKSIQCLGAATAAAAVLAGSAAWAWGPEVARACGGFFCSQANPVNQSAEQIIFVHDAEEHQVTAVIQIQYAGPSEKFAWLLPVPGTPTPGVSSNTVFQRLKAQTDPQYSLEVEVEGTCMDGGFTVGNNFGAAGPAAQGAATEDSNRGVTVLDQGAVGPYDYVTIMVDPSLADKADVAVEWLVDNGYDVTAIGTEVLRPYLEDELNLIAFRLTKGSDADVGSIRPVVLTYDSDLPMIPIRPTRVAAQNDMGVLVWMVAADQAIPKNYKSLLLNEALINWFCWQCNYDDVVSAAADEAGGHGFVTELGSSSEDWKEAIWSESDEENWQRYMATQFADGFDAIAQASNQFRGWDGFREAVCGAVTLPEGLDCDTFGRTPEQYRDQVQIDTTAFMTALHETVVDPVRDGQQIILRQPYLTRLYTTMSPEEMTQDPLFDINADLADVDHVHTATQIIECSPDLYTWQAPWRIELPQGGVIRGEGSQSGIWPIDVATTDLPAATKIVQLSTSGAGEVLEDNSERISRVLFEMSGTTSPPKVEPPDQGMMIGGGAVTGGEPPRGDGTAAGDSAENSGGGLCAVGAPGAGTRATLATWLLALVLVARRRRR